MDQEALESRATAPPRSNITTLSVLLNIVLLGALVYQQFGSRLALGDGVSLVIANDLGMAMTDVSLDYPDGSFKLPALAAGKSVGTTIPVPGVFEATLTYRGADGVPVTRPVKIKPIGELLIVLHIIPDSAPATDDATPPSLASSRVIVSYQGENVDI